MFILQHMQDNNNQNIHATYYWLFVILIHWGVVDSTNKSKTERAITS